MKYPIDKSQMKEAPNYREVLTCATCKYAYVDYDWHVECTRYKNEGSDHCVCDDYLLADRYINNEHFQELLEQEQTTKEDT